MLLTLLIAGASAYYNYECANSSLPWKDFVCISFIDETFFLKPCNNKFYSYCPPINTPGNSTCELPDSTPVTVLSWPGETCTVESDCAHGICQQGLCQGASFNSSCDSDQDCDPGLYCGEASTCQFQQQVGEACSRDYECVNSAGCNLTSADSGVCVTYMTFSLYDPVSPCSNSQNDLCKSGSCGSNDTANYYCIEPSSVTKPQACSNNTDCQSSVDPVLNITLESTCTCSYSPTGNAYCGLFPGDSEVQKYRQYLSQWLALPAINKCNTSRRTAVHCLQLYASNSLYIQYTYYLTQIQYFPLLQGNDQCVKDIYTSYYWTLLDQLNDVDDSDFAWVLSFSLACVSVLSL